MKAYSINSSIGVAGLLIFFILTIIFRSPDLLIGPGFWAEEGKYYYSVLQDESFFSVFTLIVRGKYQFLINIDEIYLIRFDWQSEKAT